MNIKKMLVASIAALSMIATSVVALAAETAPTVTGTVVEGDDAISLKISLSNLEKDCDTLSFKVKLPTGLKLYYADGGDYYTLADYKEYGVDVFASLKDYNNGNVTSDSTGSGMAVKNVYKSATWNGAATSEDNVYFVALSAASGKLFTADNWVQFNFKGFSTYDDLKATDADAFKLSDVQIRYTGDSAALTQASGAVAVVDPTTEVVEDEVNWIDATNVGDYSSDIDDSVATAYTAEITGDGNTYSAITWKVTPAKGDAKGRVSSASIGGEGTYTCGLAIGGIQSTAISSVQVAAGDQTPSAE